MSAAGHSAVDDGADVPKFGVGAFQDIQFHPDDTVEVEIEGIGTLANTVKPAND